MGNKLLKSYDYKISVMQSGYGKKISLKELARYAIKYMDYCSSINRNKFPFSNETFKNSPDIILKYIINSQEFDINRICFNLFEYELFGSIVPLSISTDSKLVIEVGFCGTQDLPYTNFHLIIEDKYGYNRIAEEFTKSHLIEKFKVNKSTLIWNINAQVSYPTNKIVSFQHIMDLTTKLETMKALAKLDKESFVNDGYKQFHYV